MKLRVILSVALEHEKCEFTRERTQDINKYLRKEHLYQLISSHLNVLTEQLRTFSKPETSQTLGKFKNFNSGYKGFSNKTQIFSNQSKQNNSELN